jgi:hypothetical protein
VDLRIQSSKLFLHKFCIRKKSGIITVSTTPYLCLFSQVQPKKRTVSEIIDELIEINKQIVTIIHEIQKKGNYIDILSIK